MKRVIEFDVFFLSYDEPNADLHYADLCNKVPWAKRIHGVKGSDHAHKAAADQSETDWVLTVDADNMTWYLVNAVKELSSQVDELKAEIQELKE